MKATTPRFVVFLFMLLLNIQCSKSVTKIEPEWNGKKVPCTSLAIAFLPAQPEVNDTGFAITIFGKENWRKKVQEHLYTAIRQRLLHASSCRQVVMVDDTFATNSIPLKIKRNATVEIRIPAGPLTMLADRGTDFLLIVEDYSVINTKNCQMYDENVPLNVPMNSVKVVEKSQLPTLPQIQVCGDVVTKHSCTYALVACSTGKIVQYGRCEASGRASRMNREKWGDLVNKVVDEMFRKSPLAFDKSN